MSAASPIVLKGIAVEDFRRSLLAWYDENARDLPWRDDRDPYRIWVSEIMLQQTRVAAVIEHYHEFLRRFPSVQKLAAAKEASVLAAWSGLGYYRRARMLHAAAKIIAGERCGEFPQTAGQWRDLPGIGRYTAAAIASIAFSEEVAVVDGNVERVLQRLHGKQLEGDEFWREAEALLDHQRPGDFNQAMMELGATVCTPKTPSCLTCPVLPLCSTRGELQSAGSYIRQLKREVDVALHRRNGSVYLVQRQPDARVMAGMWELPELTTHNGESKSHVAAPMFTVRHSITVTDYTVRVWDGKFAPIGSGKWVPRGRLRRVPLTGLTRKILRRAGIAITESRVEKRAPA